MGGRGNSGNRNSTATIKQEEIKGTPLIFGEARIHSNFIDIDGYSNKKTIEGALKDLAKAVAKYDKDEADAITSMIKFDEIVQTKYVSGDGNAQYILEWEEVPSASRYVGNNEDSDREIEYKDGRWYLHTRIIRK